MATEKIFKFSNMVLLSRATSDILYASGTVGTVTWATAPEIMTQKSGPSNFEVEAEVGSFGSECTVNISDYDPTLLEVISATRTEKITVSSISITDVENTVGTIVDDDSKVITALAVPDDAVSAKSGFYKLVVSDKAGSMVQVFAISSPDLSPADYENYETRLLKTLEIKDGETPGLGMGINAAAAASVSFADVAEGNTTTFRVFDSGVKASRSTLGEINRYVPHVKLICLSRTIESGRWTELALDNVVLAGANFNFGEEFSANEVTGRAVFDRALGRVGVVTTFQKY